jgi:replicative DNA helicase
MSSQQSQQYTTDVEAKFQSPDTEAAYLGAVMVDATALALSAGVGLDHDDFFVPKHRWTFEAITRLHDAGLGIDVATVAGTLTEMSRLEDTGGREWLRELVASTLSASNAESYAVTIKRHSIRRAAVRAARQAAEIAVTDDEADMDAFIERVGQPFAGLTRSMANLNRVKTYAQGCDEVLEHLTDIANGKPAGLLTGLADLDRVLHGLKAGKFYIIAARPGTGKTTLAHGAALNIIQSNNARSLLVSAEMSTLEVAMRLLAMEASVSTESIENGTLNDEDLARLLDAVDAARAGHGQRLVIMDDSRVTPEGIRAQALAMKYAGGLDVVFVDYLQLLNSGRDEKNRQAEVAHISRSLKILARELNIPVVALSQLSRQVESRHDKRPMLSDLRDSGALEQDADAVLMLYNDADYNPDSEEPNVTEIIIPKNRSGRARGVVKAFFLRNTPEFKNLDVHTVPLN